MPEFQTGELYRKSWAGDYFGRDGAIELAKARCVRVARDNTVEAYSGLSSTYYSAAGHAYARLRQTFSPHWAVRAWYCMQLAVDYSDKMVENAGGVHALTVDQLDIRQSIYRKAAKMLFGKKRRREFTIEALRCIRLGLDEKNAQGHARGLLLVGLIDIHTQKNPVSISAPHNIVREWIHEAHNIAEETAPDDPNQASRIFNGCAVGFERVGNSIFATKARKRARELSESTGAKDQLLKQEAR